MSSRTLKNLALVAILAGTVAGAPLQAQEQPSFKYRPRDIRDMSKMRIEMPVKGIIGNFREPLAADVKPVEKREIQRASKPANSQAAAKTLGSSQKSGNKHQPSEKVEPGKVRWHKAIQTAMDASRESHKPVLLFQMMGHLDDRFC